MAAITTNSFTQLAKQDYFCLGDHYTFNKIKGFSSFSPAYVVTNEDLRWVSSVTKDKTKKVLTVTGSGDQALFYALNGATEIDTFDISFCAKVISDIKTSAIQKIPYKFYTKLLCDLHETKQISSVPFIKEIITNVPTDSAQFLKQMDRYNIFSNGIPPDMYQDLMLTEQEFKLLQSKISKPFNFIWSDIGNIYSNLKKTYDVINLSNIFEYKQPEENIKTLENLSKYINPGGFIIAQTGRIGIRKNKHMFEEASKRFSDWANIKIEKKDPTKHNTEIMVLIQKTK